MKRKSATTKKTRDMRRSAMISVIFSEFLLSFSPCEWNFPVFLACLLFRLTSSSKQKEDRAALILSYFFSQEKTAFCTFSQTRMCHEKIKLKCDNPSSLSHSCEDRLAGRYESRGSPKIGKLYSRAIEFSFFSLAAQELYLFWIRQGQQPNDLTLLLDFISESVSGWCAN